MSPPDTPQYSQTKRFLSVKTSLGDDTLLVHAITGEEKLSTLFCYTLELLSTTANINSQQIVGKTVQFSLNQNSTTQVYNGYISEFIANAVRQENFYIYRAVVRPWLWLLTKSSNSRIFQDQTVIQVIQTVFDQAGFNDYDFSGAKKSYPKRDYCVQYGESDFNFVSRLMEEVGLFYYFTHDSSKHTLVIADQAGAYGSEKQEPVPFYDDKSRIQGIKAWQHTYTMQTGKYTTNSHNFQKPTTSLLATTTSILGISEANKREQYYYAPFFNERSDSGDASCLAMVQLESQYDIVSGKSNCMTFRAGDCISLHSLSFSQESNKKYALIGVNFKAFDNSYFSNAQPAGAAYENSFSCISAKTTFLVTRTTPKPTVLGLQEAVVTGPAQESLYTDEYGRIKVRFFWDRNPKDPENSSCWMRVVQRWEGILRIGTPVLVAFINQDIDQPVVIGPVVDDNLKPLFELPANKTMSGLKRRITKSSEEKTYNYMSFEDKADNQQLCIYASKDMLVTVENDSQMVVNSGNSTININKGDLLITVSKGKYQLTVNGDITISTKGNAKLDSVGSFTIDAQGAININSKQDVNIQSGTGFVCTAGTSLSATANGNMDLQAGLTNIKADGVISLQGTLIKNN